MNGANLRPGAIITGAHMQPLTIAVVAALAVTCVLTAVTASAISAIAVAEIRPEAQRYNLTHGSAVALPPGKNPFAIELVPVVGADIGRIVWCGPMRCPRRHIDGHPVAGGAEENLRIAIAGDGIVAARSLELIERALAAAFVLELLKPVAS